MKGRIISNVTPQQKIVGVNNKFGNTNIKQQQGTTRVIFDSLPIDGRSEYRFFENANTRQFPFTNIGAEGNRLNVGETLVVQKVYFGKLVYDVDPDTQALTNGRFEYADYATSGVEVLGNWSFMVANSQVIKELPLSQTNYPNNIQKFNVNDIAFETFTDIVVPPLLEYVLSVKTAGAFSSGGGTQEYWVCFIEGTAGILAPQTTF